MRFLLLFTAMLHSCSGQWNTWPQRIGVCPEKEGLQIVLPSLNRVRCEMECSRLLHCNCFGLTVQRSGYVCELRSSCCRNPIGGRGQIYYKPDHLKPSYTPTTTTTRKTTTTITTTTTPSTTTTTTTTTTPQPTTQSTTKILTTTTVSDMRDNSRPHPTLADDITTHENRTDTATNQIATEDKHDNTGTWINQHGYTTSEISSPMRGFVAKNGNNITDMDGVQDHYSSYFENLNALRTQLASNESADPVQIESDIKKTMREMFENRLSVVFRPGFNKAEMMAKHRRRRAAPALKKLPDCGVDVMYEACRILELVNNTNLFLMPYDPSTDSPRASPLENIVNLCEGVKARLTDLNEDNISETENIYVCPPASALERMRTVLQGMVEIVMTKDTVIFVSSVMGGFVSLSSISKYHPMGMAFDVWCTVPVSLCPHIALGCMVSGGRQIVYPSGDVGCPMMRGDKKYEIFQTVHCTVPRHDVEDADGWSLRDYEETADVAAYVKVKNMDEDGNFTEHSHNDTEIETTTFFNMSSAEVSTESNSLNPSRLDTNSFEKNYTSTWKIIDLTNDNDSKDIISANLSDASKQTTANSTNTDTLV